MHREIQLTKVSQVTKKRKLKKWNNHAFTFQD